MKKVKIRIAILVGTLVVLSSCSVYGTKFECKAGVGARCASISKVNEMIDNEDIDGEIRRKASTPSYTPESVFVNNSPNDLSLDSKSQSGTEEQTQERQERQDKPATKPQEQGLSHKQEKNSINLWLPKTFDRAEKYIRIK